MSSIIRKIKFSLKWVINVQNYWIKLHTLPSLSNDSWFTSISLAACMVAHVWPSILHHPEVTVLPASKSCSSLGASINHEPELFSKGVPLQLFFHTWRWRNERRKRESEVKRSPTNSRMDFGAVLYVHDCSQFQTRSCWENLSCVRFCVCRVICVHGCTTSKPFLCDDSAVSRHKTAQMHS